MISALRVLRSPAVVIATRGRCFDTPMTKNRRHCLTKPVSCRAKQRLHYWLSACTTPQPNEKSWQDGKHS